MKNIGIRVLSLCCSSVTLFCTLMAIQTGGYSTSEKWGYSGLSFGLFCVLNTFAQHIISDFCR